MTIRIIKDPIKIKELQGIASRQFGTLVKAVVDIEQGIMAIGGELHADEESVLLEEGSQQNNLWGINLYQDKPKEEMIEFDSMINVRPAQNNNSRSVESAAIQEKIKDVVHKLVIYE